MSTNNFFRVWYSRVSSLLVVAVTLIAWGAHGQGTVILSSSSPGVFSTRVYLPDTNYPFLATYGNTSAQLPPGNQNYTGALLSGGAPNGWIAQLWVAPGANQSESALAPAYPITTFRTGGAAGTVTPVTVVLPGIVADAPVATAQVRVWSAKFSSWSDAQSSMIVGDIFGKSQIFNVEAIGGGTNSSPVLANLRSFSLIQLLLDTPVTPLFISQPQSVNVPVGGTAAFGAQVACPAFLTYAWQFHGSNVAIGALTYPGVTNHFAFPGVANSGGRVDVSVSPDLFNAFPSTNTIQITNVHPAQAGLYSLKITNSCCPLSPPPPPIVVSQTVVLTVGNPGALSVNRAGASNVVLNWDGVFILQSATSVAGPFVDVPGPIITGPFTNIASGDAQFFRLRN